MIGRAADGHSLNLHGRIKQQAIASDPGENAADSGLTPSAEHSPWPERGVPSSKNASSGDSLFFRETHNELFQIFYGSAVEKVFDFLDLFQFIVGMVQRT